MFGLFDTCLAGCVCCIAVTTAKLIADDCRKNSNHRANSPTATNTSPATSSFWDSPPPAAQYFHSHPSFAASMRQRYDDEDHYMEYLKNGL